MVSEMLGRLRPGRIEMRELAPVLPEVEVVVVVSVVVEGDFSFPLPFRLAGSDSLLP